MTAVVRRLMIGLTLFTLAGAGSALAQQPASQPPASSAGTLRVAFVRAQAILRGMPGYAKAESTWTKEAQAAQAEGQRLKAAFDSTVEIYRQSSAMMSPSARTAREKVLGAQNDSLQARLQTLQERVDTKERELLTPMQTRLQAIIDGIRAEMNFAMVIDLDNQLSANIVSYDKSLDITDRVMRRVLQSN